MNLYQIEKQYLELAQVLIDNGGECTPEQEQELSITTENLEHKGRQYGYVVLQLESDVEQIDSEIKRLTALKKSRSNAVDRLKSTLSQAMQLFGINEIKTPTLKINFRKSKSIEIVSESQLDRKYVTVKQVETISKSAIKSDIEAGIEVAGAIQVESLNLQIK